MKQIKIILIAFLFVNTLTFSAQKKTWNIATLDSEIPIDPSIKIGKLSNGLTYYIKHNAKPKDKAELRLVLKAGSVLEDEDQLGLAHFIEHMAFNGTKSFEKNKLIDYLQSLGVEFGADLNAHTSFDETVYKLSVPTDEETLTTSLHVLRDWADGITFEDEEIDNERGIVAEELRARSGAGTRMYYQSIPIITNNSRYAQRSPIGTLDVIMNAKYDALKRYYNDWYRPDLMALVLVGDFDLIETEKKVKTLFESMTAPNNPRERIYYEIPENEAPKVSINTDKEARGITISIYNKKQETEVKTLSDYKEVLLQKLYTGMLRQRLSEVELQPNAPFLSAIAGIGNFLANMDAYYLRATLKEDQLKQGIEALVVESERAKRYGFTTTELERYKTVMLNNVDIRRKEVGKLTTKYYIEQYIDNFTDNEPIPSDEFLYSFYKNELSTITNEMVNNVGKQWIKNDNMAIVLNAIEKEGLTIPNEDEILQIISNVSKSTLEPYSDSLDNVQLMPIKPKPGKINKAFYNKKVDVTTWQLANGITIMVKPTKFQNDLITMIGFRPGGSSVAPDSLYVSARNASSIIGSSGINGISNIDLKKLNMGKTIKITPLINFYEEMFSGSSSSTDLERMLQMMNLYVTKPNKDENVFEAAKENLKSIYKDQDNSPGVYFDKVIDETMSQNHLRAIPLTVTQIENELNLDTTYNFYNERFASVNGFTFVFVGSFEIEALKKLTAQYLGSLPTNLKEKSMWKDTGLRRPKGVIKKTIVKGVDNKSVVDMRFTGTLDYSDEKSDVIVLLSKLLKIKLTEELREKMAGVYGVQVSGFSTDKPYEWYRMNIRFSCAPENVDRLIEKVFEEINKIKEEGASTEDLNKIKEAELANTKDALDNNNYWAYKLKSLYENNLKLESILDYKISIEKLNSKTFQDAANTYFDISNYAEFILKPENKK